LHLLNGFWPELANSRPWQSNYRVMICNN
jgi:hypothetical protein